MTDGTVKPVLATAAPLTDPWYRGLTGYHWFVLAIASLGWMFDTMAQQLFNLARRPAMIDLLGPGTPDSIISEQAGYSTMIFMMGWALGGVVFGILGDRIGRAKTMILTILLYSGFTGLSYFLAVPCWTSTFTVSSAAWVSADSLRSGCRWSRK